MKLTADSCQLLLLSVFVLAIETSLTLGLVSMAMRLGLVGSILTGIAANLVLILLVRAQAHSQAPASPQGKQTLIKLGLSSLAVLLFDRPHRLKYAPVIAWEGKKSILCIELHRVSDSGIQLFFGRHKHIDNQKG